MLYIMLGIYAFVYEKIDDRLKKSIFCIAIIGLSILAGTRNVQVISTWGGADDYVYMTLYQETPKLDKIFTAWNSGSRIGGYEIGYAVFTSVLKTIGLSYYGVIIVISSIFYISVYIGFKRYIGDYSIFVLTLMYKLFTYYTMVAMRQCLAMSVFFLSIPLLEKKKLMPYLLMCVLAITFHNGSLYLPFVYILMVIPLDKEKYITINIVFAITLIVEILHINVFGFVEAILSNIKFISSKKIDTLGNEAGGISWLHTFEYYTIVYMITTQYNNITCKEKNGEFIIRVMLAIAPVFTLFSQYLLFTRIKDYFTLFYGIIITYIIKYYSIREQKIIRLAFIIWAIYGFFRHILNFGGGLYYRYYESNIISIIRGAISLFQ